MSIPLVFNIPVFIMLKQCRFFPVELFPSVLLCSGIKFALSSRRGNLFKSNN